MKNRRSSFTAIIQRLFNTIVTAAIAVAVLMPVTSQAQDSGAVLEEILVTATRRAGGTNIQTTPVAVTAIGAQDFTELFAHDIGGIAQLVPNFSAAQITGFNAAGFAIRGAGQTDILVYWEPPVGMLIDDFVVPHMQTQLLEPYDIEQVEVLRGPQGTLFGKNTTAGVVSVRTKRPHFDGVAFDASARAGNYGRVEGRAALNLPIVDDKLAFRIAAISQQSDGYYKNGKVSLGVAGALGAAGDYVGDGRDLGGDDVVSARAKFLWTPNDDVDILFQYELLRDNSDTPPAVNETANPEQLFAGFGLPGVNPSLVDPLDFAGVSFRDTLASGESSGLNLAGGHQIDVDGFYLNVDWRFANFDLVSVTGFRDQESRLPSTYTGEVGTTVLPAVGDPIFSVFDATRDDNRETFQQEFRLASKFDGAFNFVTGVFYQTDETSFNVVQYLGIFELFGLAGPDDNPIVITNNQDMDSTGVFFDATIDFADTWTIAGGVRYTSEEKKFFSRPSTPFAFYGMSPGDWPFDPNNVSQFPCDAVNTCQTDSRKWDEPTYRLMVSNQFNDDLYGYLSFSHGFKSGGYSDQAGSALAVPLSVTRYEPEEADSFEVGLKLDFLDGRARLNTAVFFVEYTDMQRAAIVTNTATAAQETVVFNAGQVSASGIELEGSFLFNENWSGRLNLGYLDAEFDEFLLDLDLDGTCTPGTALCQDLSGRPVSRAPELQFGADLTYNTQIGDAGGLRAQVSVYYQDKNTFYYAAPAFEVDQSAAFMSQWDTDIEEYTLFDAFVTYTHDSGKWYASIYGKNLSDERYHSASQYVGGLWTFSTYAPPLTYGIEFGVTL